MREFHDWRHTGITKRRRGPNVDARDHAHGGPLGLQDDAEYFDLPGVVFADEVGLLSGWYGGTGTKNRYEVSVHEPSALMESGNGPSPARWS